MLRKGLGFRVFNQRWTVSYQAPCLSSPAKIEMESINRELRLCLQDAVVARQSGIISLEAETRALGYTESEMWQWLDSPATAPLQWTVCASNLLGVTTQVSSLLIDALMD
jgi:hypothetical protein